MAKRKSKSRRSKKSVKEVHHDTRIGKFFHLTWGKLVFTVFIIILLGFFHNYSYALFGIREPFVFLIGLFLVIIYLIKAIIYTLIHLNIHKNIK